MGPNVNANAQKSFAKDEVTVPRDDDHAMCSGDLTHSLSLTNSLSQLPVRTLTTTVILHHTYTAHMFEYYLLGGGSGAHTSVCLPIYVSCMRERDFDRCT